MTNLVYIRTYNEPEFDMAEILRYTGCKVSDEKIISLIDDSITEVREKLVYRVCYREFPIKVNKNVVDLSFAETNSRALINNLCDCKKIVLFAATIGLGIDRLIAKYSKISPARALIFQAIGAERIESLCDTFNNDIRKMAEEIGANTKPRFSPGYGDLTLALQRDIFAVLDCNRKIGLSLNDSLLMSPSKSVTAIIGVTDGRINTEAEAGKCSNCKNYDCSFRSK